MSNKRKRFPADEIVRLLRQHLLHGVPVPQICKEYDLHPTIVYRWKRDLFRKAPIAFQSRLSIDRLGLYRQRLRELKVLLRTKDKQIEALKQAETVVDREN